MPNKYKSGSLTNIALTAAMLLCLLVGGGWLAGSAVAWLSPEEAVASSARDGQPRFVTKDIEDIERGDYVLAFNPETGKVKPKRVLDSFQHNSDHLRVLSFRTRDSRKQTIKTTNEHPFWLPERGEFVDTEDLEVGDQVRGPRGELQTLAATVYEPHPEGVPVYNFKVEGWHTYFVAAGRLRGPPVLVHNANCGKWYHGTTDDETVTTIGLETDQLEARLDADKRGFFVSPSHEVAEQYANGRAFERGRNPVILEADNNVIGPYLDDVPYPHGGEQVIPAALFPQVPRDAFRRLE